MSAIKKRLGLSLTMYAEIVSKSMPKGSDIYFDLEM